ncbi:MAG: hypothetical protein K8U03_20175 [Planctomycetia bacterium]|nr:hypothetical protein [Planctomycetia bacterium]
MPHLHIYSNEPPLWQDAARRLHRATVEVFATPRKASAECAGVVFAGDIQADAASIERELNAGRHVLVAAEPCLSRESLLALEAAAKRKKVRFTVVNPDRWLPSRQVVRKQLGGSLGSPELVRIHRWESHASAATTAPLGLPGALVAEIEQALWLIGRPLESVFALEHRAAKPGGDGGRFLQVHLKFCPGMAVIDYDDRLPHSGSEPNEGYRSLSVIGASGSAQTDDQANSQLAYRGGSPRALVVGEGVAYLASLVDDFAAGIEAGKEPSDDVASWLEVVDAVAAVQRSLAERQVAQVAVGERKGK